MDAPAAAGGLFLAGLPGSGPPDVGGGGFSTPRHGTPNALRLASAGATLRIKQSKHCW